MPWQGVSSMDLRLRFITDYLSGLHSVTELAADYDISRKTAHYWIRHYQREGLGRLEGASRRPLRMPRATTADIVAQLEATRQRFPSWGAGKIRDFLVRTRPETSWPCRDTIHTLLVRAGHVRRRRRRATTGATVGHLTVPTAPNMVWTVDFKGEFRTGDGALCYPFTLRDGYSRFVLRCTALSSTRGAETHRQLTCAFAEYGLPSRIRSDNGAPFGARHALAGLSRLAVGWLRLGIMPERIRPGRPGENGSHEQFHGILKRETARPPAPTCRAQQKRFARFVAEYNHVRPHDAVEHAPPATRYVPSPRPLPHRLPVPDYPLTATVRRVSTAGQVKWHGRALFLSTVLADEDVAFEPTDDGIWLVRFAAFPLALFNERTWRLQSPSASSPPQTPRS